MEKLGEYSIAGLSGQFYGFFRVTAEELFHCIEDAESDEDVVKWLHERVHIDDDMRKAWNAVAENPSLPMATASTYTRTIPWRAVIRR